MLQKTLFRRGHRIDLRPLCKEDMNVITVWINDPDVHTFLTTKKPMTLESELDWYEELRKSSTDMVFVIVLKETGEAIGVMGLHQVDHMNGTATTGSFIGVKEYWSKGYGTEAKMLVLDFAFNTLNLRKVCSSTYDFNIRSQRALMKCGYKVDGVKKKHKYRKGRYCDEVFFAVFKKDFMPLWRKFKKGLP